MYYNKVLHNLVQKNMRSATFTSGTADNVPWCKHA